MKSELMIALTQVAAERHLPREQVLIAIEAALASAFRKEGLVPGQNVSVKLNPNSGEVNVYATKTVVEEVDIQRCPDNVSLWYRVTTSVKGAVTGVGLAAAGPPVAEPVKRFDCKVCMHVLMPNIGQAL